VGNSPQNFTDPLGLVQEAVTAGSSLSSAFSGHVDNFVRGYQNGSSVMAPSAMADFGSNVRGVVDAWTTGAQTALNNIAEFGEMTTVRLPGSDIGFGAGPGAIGTVGRASRATMGAVRNANFAQNNNVLPTKAFSETGSEIYSAIAGRPINTVGDLTNALKSGVVKPGQIPVDFVDMNSTRLILNTRTSTALQDAGIPRSQWYGSNKTGVTVYGNTTFDDLAAQQLRNNNLPPTGSSRLGR